MPHEVPPLFELSDMELQDQATSPSCMECEVKDAEINVLRKRIQKMQEQADEITLPNDNDIQSQQLPSAEDKVSPFKVRTS